MFSNRALLANIKDADKPIDVYSRVGTTHCSMAEILDNTGEVYLHKNGLANILSYAKVKDRHNITYDDVRDVFTVHTPYKRIHFWGGGGGYIIITVNPTERSVGSHPGTLFNKTKKTSQIEKSRTQKRQDLHTTWWDAHQWQISSAWYMGTC